MPQQIGTVYAILGIDTKAFTSGLIAAEGRLRAFAATANNIGRNMQRYVTTPLLVAGGAAAFFAGRFEAEMTKIETLVGVQRDQVKAWSDELLKMAPAVGKGPGELAKALFVVTSAGERTQRAMEIVESSAKAAAIGLGDTQEVARTVTSVMQAYGAENISASQAVEVLVKTVREGNLEASELAGTLGRVIGIASQLGVEFSQVGGFIATFTRLGVDSAEAVTALRGTLNLFLKATEQGKGALRGYGIAAEDVIKAMDERGLAGTLVHLLEIIGDNKDALGKILPNVRALAGVLGVAGAQSLTAVQIAEKLGDSLRIVEAGFDRTAETAKQDFAQALAAVEVALIKVGNILLPHVKRFLEAVVTLSERWSNLSRAAQSQYVAIAVFVAIIGPAIRLIGLLSLGLAALTKTAFAVIPAIETLKVAIIGMAGAATAGGGALGVLQVAMATVGGPIIAILLAGLGALVGWLTFSKLKASIFAASLDDVSDSAEDLVTSLRKLNHGQRETIRAHTETALAALEVARAQAKLRREQILAEIPTSSGEEAQRLADDLAEVEAEIRELNPQIRQLEADLADVAEAAARAQGDVDGLADRISKVTSLLAAGEDAWGGYLEAMQAIVSDIGESFRTGLITDPKALNTLGQRLGNSLGQAVIAGAIEASDADAFIEEWERTLGALVGATNLTADDVKTAVSFMRGTFSDLVRPIRSSIDIVGDLRGELAAFMAQTATSQQTAESFMAGFNFVAGQALDIIEEYPEKLGQVLPILGQLGDMAETAFDVDKIGIEDLNSAIGVLNDALTELNLTGQISLETWQKMTRQFREAGEEIRTAADQLQFFNALIRMSGISAESVAAAYAQAGDAIVDAFQKPNADIDALTDSLGDWKDAGRLAVRANKMELDSFRDSVESVRQSLILLQQEQGIFSPTEFKATLKELDGALDGLESQWKEFAEALKLAGEAAARSFVRGLIDGFKNGTDFVKRALKVLLETAIIKYGPKLLGIASPSKLSMAWGGDVAVGLALGLQGGVGVVQQAAGRLAGAIVAAQASIQAPIRRIADMWGKTVAMGVREGLHEGVGDLSAAVRVNLGAAISRAQSSVAAMVGSGIGKIRGAADMLAGAILDVQDTLWAPVQAMAQQWGAMVAEAMIAAQANIRVPVSAVAQSWGTRVAEGVKAGLSDGVRDVAAVLSPALQAAMGLVQEGIAAGLAGGTGAIRQATARLMDMVVSAQDAVWAPIRSLGESWGAAVAAGMGKGMGEGVRAAGRSAAQDWGASVAGGVKTGLSEGVRNIATSLGPALQTAMGVMQSGIAAGLAGGMGPVRQAANRLMDAVTSAQAAVWAPVRSLGESWGAAVAKGMREGMRDGIRSAGRFVTADLRLALDRARAAIQAQPLDIRAQIQQAQLAAQGLPFSLTDTAIMMNAAMVGSMPAMPAVSLNVEGPDLSRLPPPLTPREAAQQREWAELWIETFRAVQVGGFRP